MHTVYESSIGRYEKRKRWQQVVSAWQASDLTAKAFCQAEHIKIADLKRWSYRLNKSVSVALKKMNVASTTPPFIPVTISHPVLNNNSVDDSAIEIVLEKNIILRIRKNFDATLLLQLIQVLKGIETC